MRGNLDLARDLKLRVRQKIGHLGQIPLSLCVALMISGTRIDCPGLPLLGSYLSWTGAVGVGLIMISFTSKPILDWILDDRDLEMCPLTRGEEGILNILMLRSPFFFVFQVIVLFVGYILVLPFLSRWNYSDRNSADFCDYGDTILTLTLLGTSTICALIVAQSALVLLCFSSYLPKDEVFDSYENILSRTDL